MEEGWQNCAKHHEQLVTLEKYEGWVSQSDYAGGPTFDYYVKQLQKQGYLKYRNGKWEVTEEAEDI